MRKEELLELGIGEEIAKTVMVINGLDIQKVRKELESAQSELKTTQTCLEATKKERDAHKTQLDDVSEKLKAFDGVDLSEKDATIKKLVDDLAAEKQSHETNLAKIKRTQENQEFFASLEMPFCNEETRDVYLAKLDAALDDPANVGKGRREILDTLIVGEDGKPKVNIFKQPENPNQLNIPPVGDLPDDKPTPKKPDSMFF